MTFDLAGSTPASMRLAHPTPTEYCALRAGGIGKGGEGPPCLCLVQVYYCTVFLYFLLVYSNRKYKNTRGVFQTIVVVFFKFGVGYLAILALGR